MPRPWPEQSPDCWKAFVDAFDPHGLLSAHGRSVIYHLYMTLAQSGYRPKVGFSAQLGGYRRRKR